MKTKKTFKIENAQHKFFESKEHYLNFRKAWKDFIKSKKHLKYSHGAHWMDPNQPLRPESDLKFVHHFLYAALRGKDLGAIITPDSCHDTYQLLETRIMYATSYLKQENKTPYSQGRESEQYQQLTLPFGDTLTKEMIVELLKNIPPISQWPDKITVDI